MQIKIKMRCHFTPTRKAIIKLKTCWQRCEVGALIHCWNVQPLWKAIWQNLKQLNIGTSKSTPRYILNSTENIWSYRNMCTNVHSNIIHMSKKVEITQMLVNWRLNKGYSSSQGKREEAAVYLTELRASNGQGSGVSQRAHGRRTGSMGSWSLAGEDKGRCLRGQWRLGLRNPGTDQPGSCPWQTPTEELTKKSEEDALKLWD